MYPNPHRSLRTVGLSLVVAGVLASLVACGRGAPAQNTAGIHPGTGQSLAGSPGATAAGATAAGSSGATAAGSHSPMPAMSMPARTSTAAPVPTGGHRVAIKNFAFSPAALVVPAGTTVTWTNQDTEAHTVTGGPLRSAALNTGQTYSYTFTTVGTYSYLCTIHPFMTATVTVTK